MSFPPISRRGDEKLTAHDAPRRRCREVLLPELPEVETVALQLQPRVVGRTVRAFRIFDPRLRHGRTPPLAGRRIADVSRSGKRVLIEFGAPGKRGAPLWLAVHLRMTGRLIWEPRTVRSVRAPLRARFDLDRGSLLFVDTRRFGTMDWFASPEAAAPAGLDPLSAAFTARKLDELVGEAKQRVKAWLLRQDRLVGLGNIYASEILHAARISPFREVASLDRSERRRLHRSIKRILERAIENCGTTFADFQDARGVEGSYQNLLAVYGREDRACRRCRSPIRREVQQQRSTFFCSSCQR
jgi:formamidopyrimidine-DNA glycosylase